MATTVTIPATTDTMITRPATLTATANDDSDGSCKTRYCLYNDGSASSKDSVMLNDDSCTSNTEHRIHQLLPGNRSDS